MAFYSIKKGTGIFGGYHVEGWVHEGWYFTLDGAKRRIKRLEAADDWDCRYAKGGLDE